MLIAVLASLLLASITMQPRVLQRAHGGNRTRIGTFNCRTLLDDSRMHELDTALTDKGIDICALQETRRDGFYTYKTDNYVVHYYGECSGKYGVGFAVHKRLEHLTSAPSGIPD